MNPAPRKIIVFGSSLLLSVIADFLSAQEGMEVRRAPATASDAVAQIESFSPDVILVEQNHEPGLRLAEALLEMFTRSPGKLLISLNLETNALTVFSSHQAPVNSLADLVQVIERASQSVAASDSL